MSQGWYCDYYKPRVPASSEDRLKKEIVECFDIRPSMGEKVFEVAKLVAGIINNLEDKASELEDQLLGLKGRE